MALPREARILLGGLGMLTGFAIMGYQIYRSRKDAYPQTWFPGGVVPVAQDGTEKPYPVNAL